MLDNEGKRRHVLNRANASDNAVAKPTKGEEKSSRRPWIASTHVISWFWNV